MLTTRDPARPRQTVRAVRRFWRSPKGILLLVLALLTVVAALAIGPARVAPGVLGAMLTAAIADLAIARWTRGVWIFPDGALLTGVIIALILSPTEPVYVPIGTAAVAIGGKYLFRSRGANVFNPAALALVVAYFAFGSGESWWGALPDLPPLAIVLLLAAGLFIADRVNKLPMVLVFLGASFALFALSAFTGDPSRVAEVFRVPDVNAALFFALFMLDDPPTSPVRYLDQTCYALIVAVVSFAAYLTLGAEYYLLAGLLVGNAWEALRRWDERPARRAATA